MIEVCSGSIFQEGILRADQDRLSHHLGPGWHLHSKHTHASAAAAVPALLIVHMDCHFLVGLQHKGLTF